MFEFTQALKFKVSIPDANFLLLADLILRDSGGAVLEEMGATPACRSAWSGLMETPELPGNLPNVSTMLRATGGCDVTRAHMSDILEFLADVHTLTKVYLKFQIAKLNFLAILFT